MSRRQRLRKPSARTEMEFAFAESDPRACVFGRSERVRDREIPNLLLPPRRFERDAHSPRRSVRGLVRRASRRDGAAVDFDVKILAAKRLFFGKTEVQESQSRIADVLQLVLRLDPQLGGRSRHEMNLQGLPQNPIAGRNRRFA